MRRLRTSRRRSLSFVLAALAVAAVAAVPVVSWGASFEARASVDPVVMYLQDSGTVLTFTVHNIGTTDGIGAVEISRPSGSFTVVACPQAPAGWSTQAATDKCRYRSASGTADDIPPGASDSHFRLTASAAGGKADYSGTWKVVVSKSNQFDDKSKLAAAPSQDPGLTVKVHSFEILDAVVTDAPVTPGSACPAANRESVGGATHVIVICGKNRSSGTLTPTAAQSSLAGTFIASSGTFSSGPIASKSSSSRVLGNWTGAQISGTKGTNKTVIAKVGASSKETSPLTTLFGYEVTNQAPTADPKTVTGVSEDGSKSIELSGDDADGDAMQFLVVSGPSHGSLGTIDSLSCNSATPNHCTANVLYTPDPDYNGSDSFTYKTRDAFNDSSTVTVSITVDPVNDAPSASDTSVSVDEDDSVAIDLTALVDDVETADADLEYVIVDAAAHGDFSGGSYAPDANFNGSDSFTYKVTDRGDPDDCGAPGPGCDAAKSSSTVTVSITVDPVNDAPSASGTSVSVDEDDSVVIDLATLVSDVETSDATLTYTVVDSPAHGDFSGGSYAPDANFNGSDSFTYKVTDRGDPDNCGAPGPGCDAAKSSSTVTVSITVDPVNDAPVNHLPAGPLDAVQETDTPIAGISVTDVDAGSQDVQLELSVEHGTLTVSESVVGGVGAFDVGGNGTLAVTLTASLSEINATLADPSGLVYQGDLGYIGPDTLTVVSDDLGHTGAGGALTDTDTLAITVRPLNQPPVADGKSVTTGEDAAKTITLTASDADGDDPLSFAAGDPSHGSVGTVGAVTCDQGIPNNCHADVTYTPDPDYSGPDAFTYTANDGTIDSAPATVSITVTPVNDAPVIAGIETGELAYTENGPATAITGTATVSDVDSANFDTGTLTVDYSVGGTADDRLEIANQGNLPGEVGVLGSDVSYGGTTIGSFAGGSGTTALVVTLDADATPVAVQALVRAITYRNVSENPSEAARTARFVVTDGDGLASAAATRAIAVTAVHDVPVLADIEAGALSYTENDASIAITSTLTVTDADSDLTGATVTIGNFDAGDDLIFVNTASITGVYNTGTGVLSLTGNASAADYQTALRSIGYASSSEDPSTATRTITFQVKDGPDAANLSNTASRDIDVTAVDDPPSVDTSAGSTSYTENAAATAIDAAVTVSDPDVSTITGATVEITGNYAGAQDVLALAGSHPAIAPAVAGDTLTLTGDASAAAYQSALRDVTYLNSSDNPSTLPRTVTFTVTDDTSLSGSDTKGVTVTAVDDPPTAVNDSATVLEDAAATAVTVLTNDTDVDGGPKTIGSAGDPANGTVVVTGGGTGLTYQPDANYCNDPPGATKDTFTYTLNGGSTATVSVSVTCVNDAPVADDESFSGANSAVGNTTLVMNDPSDGAPATPDPTDTSPVTDRPHKTITGDILDGDSDIDGPGPLTVTPGTFATNDGGSVTIQADGDFTFEPAAPTSCTDTSDFFDYTVSDQNATGPGPTPGTDTGRVTIAISGCVWYVNNDDAQGNSGTSEKPFDTLAQAETASGTGHSIFVYDGNDTSTGYAAGINLKANQKLIGEAAALIVGSDNLHGADAANKPSITDNGADVVDLASGNEVRGFNIDPQGSGGGIFGGATDTGGTIDDVNIVDTGTAGSQPGLELNGTAGAFNVSNLVVNSNGATGVLLLNNSGTVSFASAGTISITSAGAAGLSATGTNMGTSTFDSITVTGSTSGGVNMSGTSGTTTFGDLVVTTSSGGAAAFGLANAGGTVTVGAAGTDNVSATGGPAVDVTGAAGAIINLAFDAVSSTNSASDGINLAGLGAGTFSAASGAIAGAAGIAFDLDGGSGAVSYPGALNNGAGQTAEITSRSGGAVALSGAIADTNDAGGGISLSGNTGGSTTFSNASKVLNTTTSDAVSFTGSDGHTLNLTGGGLDIDTTTGRGIFANNSGTLVVSGTGNTIDSISAAALSLANTDIGAGGATFQRISSGNATAAADPANGIVLNNTGATGGLTVNGNAGSCTSAVTCTGGAIQSTTGTGVSLTSVPGGVSLTRMFVGASADDGIGGSSVNGLALDNATVTGNGNANGDNGIDLTQLTGTSPFTSTTVSNNFDSNVFVSNSSGTLNLNVTGGAYSGATGGQGDGIFVEGTGTGGQNLNVQGPITFANNVGDHVQHSADAVNTTDSDVTVNNATMTSPAAAGGGPTCALNILGGGITVSHGGSSNTDLMLTNNNIQNSCIGAIAVGTTGSVVDQQSAQVDATITGNTIGTAGVAGSGSVQGNGIFVDSNGNGLVRTLIANNTVRQWTNRNGLHLDVLDGDAEMSATVRNNVFTEPNSAFAGTTTRGMTIQLGSAQVGDSIDACLDIGHPTDAALKNQVAGTGEGIQPDIRYLHEGPSSAVQLAGYSGPTAPAIGNIASYLQPRNNLVANPTVTGIGSGTGSTTTGVASCPLPAG